MKKLFSILSGGAEFIAASMLAAMFLTFLLQIFSRYVLLDPLGWTLELCLTLWLWAVFFVNAFVAKDRDQVAFDIIYLAASSRVRKVMAFISAAAIIAAMAWALLPTYEYIDFLKIRKSATLKIPMNIVFSIFGVFMLAVAARYIWRIIVIIRSDSKDDSALHYDKEPPAIRKGGDAV